MRDWSAGQLKLCQGAIAHMVFGAFMVAVLGEPLTGRHGATLGCVIAAVGFLFVGRN